MVDTVKKYLIPHEGNDHKPHLFRERAMTAIAVIAFFLFCTSLGSTYILKHTDFGAAVLPAVLVDMTNEYRLSNQQPPLRLNPTLEASALMKAKDMEAGQYFAHVSPSGTTPWQWFSKAGYSFVYAGENLAINFTESVDVSNAWIASPTHQANLISQKFDEIGIAVHNGTYQGRPTTFVVQHFGKQPTKKGGVVSVEQQPLRQATAQALAQDEPLVQGETVTREDAEPAAVLLVDEPTFTVAQNIAVEEESNAPVAETATTQKYATVGERLLADQSQHVQWIYLILIGILYIALIVMIVFEFSVQHPKNIFFGVVLLLFLGVLAYLNSTLVLSVTQSI